MIVTTVLVVLLVIWLVTLLPVGPFNDPATRASASGWLAFLVAVCLTLIISGAFRAVAL